MSVFSITLQARNPERWHFRRYHLEAGLDLFGTWLVEATFGPIGAAGRTVAYAGRWQGFVRDPHTTAFDAGAGLGGRA